MRDAGKMENKMERVFKFLRMRQNVEEFGNKENGSTGSDFVFTNLYPFT
jgi:hypothetical protein